MHTRLCLYLVIGFWLISSVIMAAICYFLTKVEFCGPVRINHFHCDFNTLILFACSDIAPLMFLTLVVSTILCATPFVGVVVSYTFIIMAILKIKSTKGRKKAFSTCSSHLVVSAIYFAIIFTLYVVPRSNNYFQVYKSMSFFYLYVIPLITPIIYTLRNQDFQKALQTTMSEMKQYVINVHF
ncbi:unnamed protein product [Staurois parvus]|uniref:G-protein coupled receptors family 1 profile domain-containing protein n=1 Tax=Staurois parvus TaxID=386267 RepID=A0ABN9ENY3_9NEOB|nr:unnamed protein product [Staurois parvus]